MLMNWKQDETNVSGNGIGIDEKNVAEMEAGNSMKLIFYFATNCPRRIVLRRIVREPRVGGLSSPSPSNCPTDSCTYMIKYGKCTIPFCDPSHMFVFLVALFLLSHIIIAPED